MSSFQFRLIGDAFSISRKLLTALASFRAMYSFPDEFRCKPWLVKYPLSRSVSRTFTLLKGAILFFSCLLKLITSLFTHDAGRRSNLGGAVIILVFTFCLFFMKSHRCFSASLELFFPMSFEPPQITATSSCLSFFVLSC